MLIIYMNKALFYLNFLYTNNIYFNQKAFIKTA